LFKLTDAKLKEDNMPRGSREKLIAAVNLVRELPGAVVYFFFFLGKQHIPSPSLIQMQLAYNRRYHF
jgi:hypothetical protein